jgi:hypothetical protein
MADTLPLRVNPLEFEEQSGPSGLQHVAQSSLAQYTIRHDLMFMLWIEGGFAERARPKAFDSLANAIQFAQEHHLAEVAKLFEPKEAQRVRPSLKILEEASATLPDEADILRLLKAPGSHRHVDVAKRIASRLRPVRAAFDMFEEEIRSEQSSSSPAPK